MSESVSVPAELVEALRESFGRDGYGPGPVQNAARALVDAVERPSELCGYSRNGLVCIHVRGHGVPEGENIGRHYMVAPASPSVPDRDEAERAWDKWRKEWDPPFTHMGQQAFIAGYLTAKEDDHADRT